MDIGALGVVARVALDTIRAHIPWPTPRRRLPSTSRGVPVFVMLPLDAWSPDCEVDLASALPRLAAAGVHGIMVDVWWGVCEPEPGVYDFSAYKRIADICRDAGLVMQATISLHACGGNVGDSVNIPLPDWVVAAGDAHHLWYTDRQGFVHRECLSLSADEVKVLPSGPPRMTEPSNRGGGAAADADEDCGSTSAIAGSSEGEGAGENEGVDASPRDAEEGDGHVRERDAPVEDVSAVSTKSEYRRPLDAYKEFIEGFLTEIGDELLRSTVVELQVGCGPCGELRYPSYPLGSGMWEFPGMGEFQCFDPRMLENLKETAARKEHPPEWGLPPNDTGTYNASPRDCAFFRRGYTTPRGVFFLQWYSGAMLEHGRSMLGVASAAMASHASAANTILAVKVSGIHWWKLSKSRAAEAAAGYYTSRHESTYSKIAELLGCYNGVLDFTCLEMRTCDQPYLKARCGPRQLVGEVFKAAADNNVRVAGENALERYDWGAYAQILKAYRSVKEGGAYGFTLLRLGPALLQDENFAVFAKFVQGMSEL